MPSVDNVTAGARERVVREVIAALIQVITTYSLISDCPLAQKAAHINISIPFITERGFFSPY